MKIEFWQKRHAINRVGTYTYCTALQMEGSRPRVCLQNWSTSSALGGLWLVQDSMWCAGHLQYHPAGLPQYSWQLLLCILQFHLCFSKLPLHLRMRVSLNVSTFWLSRPGITAPLGSIHAHSLVPRLFIQEVQSLKGYVIWGRDFPQTLPHLLSVLPDQLRESSSRKRFISLIQLVTQTTPGK